MYFSECIQTVLNVALSTRKNSEAGLKIATNTVANATNFSSLATKIIV